MSLHEQHLGWPGELAPPACHPTAQPPAGGSFIHTNTRPAFNEQRSLQLGKENLPRLVISVADLSLEMHKHVDPSHAATLRALLLALHAGLSLESFCRRVYKKMGGAVLRRTMRGLFELAQRSAARDYGRVHTRAERIRALALARKRWSEREDHVRAGRLVKRGRCL